MTLAFPVASAWPVASRQGRVSASDRVLFDETGPFNALGATFFWGLWGYQYDRQRMEENAAFLADNGVEYLRVLGEIGGESWEDRPADPRRAGYDDDIAGFTDLMYDRYGLRTEWTIFGGVPFSTTRESRVRLVDRFINMSRGREHKIMMWEGANEAQDGNFPDMGELRDLARRLQNTGILTAVSAPMGDESGYQKQATELYTGVGTIGTYHFDRGVGDDDWRFVKQPWDVQFLRDVPRASSNNEGKGPQASVAETDSPIRLAMYAATSYLCGVGAFVFHCGAGIRGGGAADLQRGRSTNVWETPNIAAILKGFAVVRSLMPADIANWQRLNGQWADHPLPADRIWTDGYDHGVVRTYGAVSGQRFVTLPFGVKEYVVLTPRQPSQVAVFNPLTGEQVLDVTGSAPIRLDNRCEAYLIKGRKL